MQAKVEFEAWVEDSKKLAALRGRIASGSSRCRACACAHENVRRVPPIRCNTLMSLVDSIIFMRGRSEFPKITRERNSKIFSICSIGLSTPSVDIDSSGLINERQCCASIRIPSNVLVCKIKMIKWKKQAAKKQKQLMSRVY